MAARRKRRCTSSRRLGLCRRYRRVWLGRTAFHAVCRQLALKVTARDAAGMTGRCNTFAQGRHGWETILLRVERAAYRVGDTLKLEVLTAGSSGAVYLDVVKEGQTLATHALPLDKGRGTLAIDLDANYLGTLELNAYRVLPRAISCVTRGWSLWTPLTSWTSPSRPTVRLPARRSSLGRHHHFGRFEGRAERVGHRRRGRIGLCTGRATAGL